MAKNKAKDKLKKNLERYADLLVAEFNAIGWEFEDSIINTKLRHVEGTGVARGIGDASQLSKFNKKGTKLISQTLSFDFDAYDGTMIQEFKYSNYKKFGKASEGSHKQRYEAIQNLMASEKTIQRGVDLLEKMPGVSDVNIYLNNFDTNEFLRWL